MTNEPNLENDMLDDLRRGVEGDQAQLSEVWNRHQERLKKLVKLRLDRRLQGRIDPTDVLQEAYIDFAERAPEFAKNPKMPLYLWLRLITGERLQLLHRHHLGAQKRDAGREVSIHRGAMPQATSVSLAAQLMGRFTSVTQAVQRAEMQVILQEAINGMEPIDREILALRHFEELSNAETAEVLDIQPSASSSRHVRALKKLRETLSSTPGFFDKK